MKLFLSEIINSLDDATIRIGTPQLALIHNACDAFLRFIIPYISKRQSILCLCGTGNNGIDGMYIAKKLSTKGYQVKVLCIEQKSHLSDIYLKSKNLIQQTQIPVDTQTPKSGIHDLNKCDVIIDGLFGNGLNRPLSQQYINLINFVNSLEKKVFAIDIPSGMRDHGEIEGTIMRCHATLAFQQPRMTFFQRESAQYLGIWESRNIGISKKLIDAKSTNRFLVDQKLTQSLIQSRIIHSHKGDFGHSLLIGGEVGMSGAIILCAQACMKIGSGKSTIMSMEGNRVICQEKLVEASFSSIENSKIDFHNFSIGIGPGLGTSSNTERLIHSVITSTSKPIVIDADALNILALYPQLLHNVPKNSILTPHTGEFHRLFGKQHSDYQRFSVQKKMAVELSIFIILKGRYTTIASPDGEFYYNSTGNSGMATGGSGDVLTGIITGLLAQSYSVKAASILGVYLHGLSGDIAKKISGEMSLMATDIIDHLPKAILELEKFKK